MYQIGVTRSEAVGGNAIRETDNAATDGRVDGLQLGEVAAKREQAIAEEAQRGRKWPRGEKGQHSEDVQQGGGALPDERLSVVELLQVFEDRRVALHRQVVGVDGEVRQTGEAVDCAPQCSPLKEAVTADQQLHGCQCGGPGGEESGDLGRWNAATLLRRVHYQRVHIAEGAPQTVAQVRGGEVDGENLDGARVDGEEVKLLRGWTDGGGARAKQQSPGPPLNNRTCERVPATANRADSSEKIAGGKVFEDGQQQLIGQ